MFQFVIRYFGFLKTVPVLAMVYDSLLKIQMFIFNPVTLKRIDEIELTILKLPGTRTSTHKYGGLQFNYHTAEMGHIHSNGLLDMLLNRQVKQELMHHGRITEHHTFVSTGWISFYIKTENDKAYAIELLNMAYQLRRAKPRQRL